MAEEYTAPAPKDTLEEDKRDTPDYWRRWVKAAEKAADGHWEMAKEAWAEYENREAAGDSNKERAYPIYWSSCKTLEPAYYSRTPKITTRRRFDIRDEIAMTSCLIAQRLGEYLVDQCEFDEVMHAVVQDFIHADKSTAQVLYEHKADNTKQRIALQQQGEQYLDDQGEAWSEEVFEDGDGYFGERSGAAPVEQRIYLASCRYDEVLHTPDAKSQAEVQEVAYYFYMSRPDAEKRFPGKNIAWKSKKESNDKRDDTEYARDHAEAIGEYVEGWEIWSKPNRTVYWLSSQCQDGFLDRREDPYGLQDFFPSPPFIVGTKPSKNLYPTPSYRQLKPLLGELHDASNKVSNLIHAIRRRAIIDPSLEELVFALESLESGEFVVAKNFQSIVEKSGVSNLIFYIPVEELVNAINELTTLQEKFKAEFYEWFGVPDILRGATEPVETATAQELKAQSAHDRFKWQKKQVAQIARDCIELMVDLALGVFDDAKVADCVGYEFMDPEDQQRFPAALQLLRNDNARTIRIEIESDSMSFVDDQLRAQQTNLAVSTITTGLKDISQMIQISPEAASVGLQALLLSLESLPAGRDFHDEVKQTLEQLIEQARQPKEPGPDYKMLQIQLEQAKLQAEQMRVQMEAQSRQRELDRKDAELQLKAGTDTTELQLKQMQAAFDQQVEAFMSELEAQRVAIENYKAQMQARESQMEEIRLAREVEAKQYQEAVAAMQTNPPAEPTPPQIINVQPAAMPPVNVTIDAKPGALPTTKRISVMRDELGNAVGYEVSDTPQAAVLPLG